MFKVNDHCLYNYNVCKVKEIVEIKGTKYYVLVPVVDESLTVKAPITQENINIRPLLSKKEINDLIKKLPTIELITLRDQELVPEYKRLLNSGNRLLKQLTLETKKEKIMVRRLVKEMISTLT